MSEAIKAYHDAIRAYDKNPTEESYARLQETKEEVRKEREEKLRLITTENAQRVEKTNPILKREKPASTVRKEYAEEIAYYRKLNSLIAESRQRKKQMREILGL